MQFLNEKNMVKIPSPNKNFGGGIFRFPILNIFYEMLIRVLRVVTKTEARGVIQNPMLNVFYAMLILQKFNAKNTTVQD